MKRRNEAAMRFAATWCLEFAGTLALLSFVYWWLTWPDEKGWQVAASLLSALVVAFFALWLQCTVFGAFYAGTGAVIVRRSLRSVPAFALWKIVFGFSELALLAFYCHVEQFAVRLAQLFHLPPRAVTSLLDWGTWSVIWVLVPALLLPIGSRIARDGFAALRGGALWNGARALRTARHWLGLGGALLAGVYLPYRLIGWLPKRASLREELYSAAARLSLAYLFAVTAIVFLSWNLARTLGEKDEAAAPQPSTSA